MPHYIATRPYRSSAWLLLTSRRVRWVSKYIYVGLSLLFHAFLLIYSTRELVYNGRILQHEQATDRPSAKLNEKLRGLFTTGQQSSTNRRSVSQLSLSVSLTSLPSLVFSKSIRSSTRVLLVVLLTSDVEYYSVHPSLPSSTPNRIIGSRTIKQSQRRIIVVHIQGRTTTTPLSTSFRWPGQVMYPVVQQDTIVNPHPPLFASVPLLLLNSLG